MPWGTNFTGNAITVWPEEHFSEYPNGGADPDNDTMSIGYFRVVAAAGPNVVVPNTTTQANSVIVTIMPVDLGSSQEMIVAGQYFYHSTANNIAGASFQINTSAAVGAFANTGWFRYWLIHPAWK